MDIYEILYDEYGFEWYVILFDDVCKLVFFYNLVYVLCSGLVLCVVCELLGISVVYLVECLGVGKCMVEWWEKFDEIFGWVEIVFCKIIFVIQVWELDLQDVGQVMIYIGGYCMLDGWLLFELWWIYFVGQVMCINVIIILIVD